MMRRVKWSRDAPTLESDCPALFFPLLLVTALADVFTFLAVAAGAIVFPR